MKHFNTIKSTRRAIALSYREGLVETLLREDAPPIPVRIFGEREPGTPVVMIHGLQSHSGWFTQSAQYMASLGMPVAAYDRSGSGLSTAKRGHCDSYRDWIDELQVVINAMLQRYGKTRIHLVGHCFGAIPATAYACEHPDKIASLILSTPAIYTRKGVYFRDVVRIGFAKLIGREAYIPVRLTPEMFTDLPEYEHFVARDHLALSFATAQFYYEIPRARRFINHHTDKLVMPVFMAIAGKDPICDNKANIRFFNTLPSEVKVKKSYADAKHILEFSRERDYFFSDLKQWFDSLNRGGRKG